MGYEVECTRPTDRKSHQRLYQDLDANDYDKLKKALLNINLQSSKLYITALSFAHKVARLAIKSEPNLPISLNSKKLKLIPPWGTRSIIVPGT